MLITANEFGCCFLEGGYFWGGGGLSFFVFFNAEFLNTYRAPPDCEVAGGIMILIIIILNT